MNRIRLALQVLMTGQLPQPTAAAAPAHDDPSADRQPSAGIVAQAQPVTDTTQQLIELRDSVQAAIETVDKGAGLALHQVARRIGEILTGAGITPIEELGRFDPARHNAVDTMATDDDALDDTLASSVRSGYLRDGVLLRRQDVIVYRSRTGRR
jgi:molecular chaperone GrpE (heat shock protein)